MSRSTLMATVAFALLPLPSRSQQGGPSWSFSNNKMPIPNCSAYWGSNLTGGTEPWTFGYIKTHPPSAPQTADLTVVTLQHRSIRLSRLQQDELVRAWIDDNPVRLQVFSYSVPRPDPFSTGYITFTIADNLQWHRLLSSSRALTIEVPGVEKVNIPTGLGLAELHKVDACDLRPKRGE